MSPEHPGAALGFMDRGNTCASEPVDDLRIGARDSLDNHVHVKRP
jgi:hypothetical protein